MCCIKKRKRLKERGQRNGIKRESTGCWAAGLQVLNCSRQWVEAIKMQLTMRVKKVKLEPDSSGLTFLLWKGIINETLVLEINFYMCYYYAYSMSFCKSMEAKLA